MWSQMPRHEVVKRIWSYCKENNLLVSPADSDYGIRAPNHSLLHFARSSITFFSSQDPKNRQFSICNDELRKVFGMFGRRVQFPHHASFLVYRCEEISHVRNDEGEYQVAMICLPK